jgi:DNA repair protein RecO (recombination protein O)
MEFSEKVLLLQVGKFKESDLWVRFLSPTRGLLSAFAFGGCRSRKRFVGCLDVFNEVSVRVTCSARNPYLALQEGVLIKGTTRLRRDWSRFGLAVNCVRFLQTFGVDADGAANTLFLMRQTLQLLEESDTLPRLLPLFFRARLAFDNGYSVETTRCSRCGTSISSLWARLLLNEGLIVCRMCAQAGNGDRGLPLGREALETLAAVKTLPPVLWGSIVLSSSGAREFAIAVDGFIQYHIGISWEKGRFIRQ